MFSYNLTHVCDAGDSKGAMHAVETLIAQEAIHPTGTSYLF
jgi:hypothetical protein